jgi:Cu+-exporting ATPase
VLDKTGTITRGEPELTDFVATGEFADQEADLLIWAGRVEKMSEHPIAQAIVRKALKEITDPDPKLGDPEEFVAVPGKGVISQVEGRKILMGTRLFMQEQGVDVRPLQKVLEQLEAAGKSTVLMAVDHRISAGIGVADTVKEHSAEAIQELKSMGIQVWMITGDNRRTALAIAQEVGIDQVLAEILPEDKAKEVQNLRNQGHIVAMVGDGINDAPALVTADVGIAMGTGTIAMEAADITLMRGDLRAIVTAIQLSRVTMRNIKQNLFWAFAYNVVGIPVAAMGLLSPMLAGGAMALSSVSVVTNALRLKHVKLS